VLSSASNSSSKLNLSDSNFSLVVRGYNVSRLGEGGEFTHQLLFEAPNSNLRKTVLRSTSPPLAPNQGYNQWFCLAATCPPNHSNLIYNLIAIELLLFICRCNERLHENLVFLRGHFSFLSGSKLI
jgi:hypothetical protein